MEEIIRRITSDPEKCGGQPCIRGMRIRVSDILELYSAGLSSEHIIEEMPDLEQEDLKAALIYASRKIDHPIIAA
ncbi:MAG: DUF433 domain-containing protein [Ignavibacteriota bacterium]|jgi:uncharacterized protein (DUF433 family)|nr:DUF433 domain-containing protein [Ignavibacteriales bacterium]MBL1122509.1 DUF433 domain-containing protein [Ignavibacteriota bacterium]MCC7095397.1 DUF433 domain-containing protein [Ignavibacteriaceae bacterium]MCE7856546.1 DUF433 domain-containing protein [Ignavibacteria bacterium CHB3]MCZ7615556.1 DUF433 domain-containing protein [Ignavibacteriaceae bacterium]